MNKSLFLKFRKLSHYQNFVYGLINKNKYSTLLSGINSESKPNVYLPYYKTRKRRLKFDASVRQYSLMSNKKGLLFPKPVDLYLLPQYIITRGIKKTNENSNDDESISHLFVPVQFETYEEGVGDDLVGPLDKDKVISVINRFYSDGEVKELAREQGLDPYLFQHTIISFRKFCVDAEKLPTDLHVVLSDVIKNVSHIHDIYPYFYQHAKDIFPHLSCMEDLCKVSDLTQPPNWYPEARAMNRKIIYHAGPTNSGKTYHAMEQYLSSESGVYCGPLKLLAVEVYEKSNSQGTSCDLVTGEERKYAISEEFPASHISCTVEMTSLENKYEVAIIDEIQMLRDPQRGWAWTRALLGVRANEVHVCGEASAISLVKELAMSIGEDIEIRRYKRLTPLNVEDKALVSLDKIQPGDCIVCFSRATIHKISQAVEKLGHEVAVIYGGLPPGAKLAQAKKFNDPDHPCKIMVATDAIGMGLNLSIRRVIFSSLMKPNLNEQGEKEMETISVSAALQIAGRAGRYKSKFSEGYVTTLKSSDLPVLQELLNSTPEDIEQAGLHPTAEQIELFAFHLPSYTLSNLIDIFVKVCTVDSSLYFMCAMDDFKFLADLIQHVQLPLRARYVFCCAPINKKMPFVCAIFLKFTRQYSQNELATFHWLCRQVHWPFNVPKTIQELIHTEEVFDVCDNYLWLSYRFPDMFPDADMVRDMQRELDTVIQLGVAHITQLLKSSELENEIKLSKSDKSAPMFKKGEKQDAVQMLSLVKKSKRRKTKEEEEEETVSQKELAQTERLAQLLIRKGIISQKLLMELKAKAENEFNDVDDEPPRNCRKRRK